jgi:tRNA A58 N-methylase Trm61
MKKPITGISVYKGTMLQQHEDFVQVFTYFLEKYKPNRILEIGTGAGGFTHFLRDTLNELGLYDTIIKSYDINHNSFHDKLNEMQNLEISSENLFGQGNDYILIKKITLFHTYKMMVKH